MDRYADGNIDDAGFLGGIAAHIRSHRARRGMSRRMLAESSGVSERYLAELEGGKGNISILRLRRIAAAISIPVEDLVSDASLENADYDYLLHHIRRADADELRRLSRELAKRSQRSPHLIALIGLRGAGKSTIGAALARHFSLPFIELVDAIEARAGMPVDEIFALGGQATYRRIERQCLDDIIDHTERGVLAIGGSLVSEPASYERLLAACVTIWLRAAPKEHMDRVIAQGDKRPMAGHTHAMEDLKRILVERESLYRRADHIIETSGRTVEETLADVLGQPAIAAITAQKEVA
jgi:XRE family aerobic/anaerobic benzoate catabolism transcriptional regulator